MKKVLFLTYDFPYPTTSGGKSRAYHMIKFGGKDLELHLFSFIRSGFSQEYKGELEKIGVKKITIFPRKNVLSPNNLQTLISKSHSVFYYLYYDKKIKDSLLSYVAENKIDVVHFESFYMGFYICDELKKMGVKQIFGTENIEYKIYEDYAKNKTAGILKPLFKREVDKIRCEEEEMTRKVDISLAVTKNDCGEIGKNGKCEIIENGVDTDYFNFKLPETNGKKILFVGNFSYFPNIDGIKYFFNEVFARLPKDFTLKIVGKKVGDLGINGDRIELIEYVEDIGDAYKNADIFVSPIRIGGGTNFKILEAMASGVPVVASPERIEDLEAAPGKEILVGNNADALVDQIILLSENYSLALSLSKSANDFVKKRYSWEKIGENLNKIWKNL